MEKAHIERSGCLAMGLNAINAYLNNGQTPETYTKYIKDEFFGVIREDLVYSIAEGLMNRLNRLRSWASRLKKIIMAIM